MTPSEIMATLVSNTPSLADSVRSLVDPIRAEREAIRRYFVEGGHIETLDYDAASYPVGAADGAYLTSQTVVGDFLATLAVATAQTEDGSVEVHGTPRHWTDFRPHSPESDVLAKAVMMLHEQVLLSALPAGMVKIIDGSHVTPLIAIFIALSSPDEAVREQVIDFAQREGLADALGTIAGDDDVIACPKSDSSTDLWEECSTALTLHGSPMPDKALATLVLEPGEVMKHTRNPPDSWRHLHAVENRVTDSRAKILARKLTTAIHPLRQGEIAVHHAKPHGAFSVIRMEMHPGVEFAEPDILASVCSSVHTPFIQEPMSQYLADIFAKNLAVLTDLQMEETRLALAETGDASYLEYLTHYRTN